MFLWCFPHDFNLVLEIGLSVPMMISSPNKRISSYYDFERGRILLSITKAQLIRDTFAGLSLPGEALFLGARSFSS